MSTVDIPTLLSATQASRHFADVLERARHGESFMVTLRGEQVARIVPPPEAAPNGAAVLAFLQSWKPDLEGFTQEIIDAVESVRSPHDRDRERLAWVDDYR